MHFIAPPNINIATATALIVPAMRYVLLSFGVFAKP